MEINKIYKFEYNNQNKTKITVEAVSEESARRKIMRRRNDYRVSYSAAYGAELLEVIETVDENNVKKIFEGLKKETVSFKKEYLERMKNYVTRDFDNTIEMYGEYEHDDWMSEFGREVKMYGGRTTKRINKDGERLRSKTNSFKRILNKGMKESHIQGEVDKYSDDFDMKLSKLAFRMDKKGFKNNIKVTSEHVGVNFNCWVTDGEKTAHAYTIIAEGPIVRPHYRYLVK